MNNVEYGQYLASQMPPLTDEQVEAAARVFASLSVDRTEAA